MIQQPNFFGQLEDVDALTDWAHARGILVIAVVNPTALARPQAARAVGRHRGGHRRRRGPAARGAAVLRRPVLRLHDHAHGARAADARAHRRPHARCRRQARLHAHPAGARAAHPARQGDLQHLHQPGPADDGGDDLPVADGAHGPGAHRGGLARAHPRARRSAHPPARGAQRLPRGRTSTRRCCSSSARWRRCSRRSPRAASAAGWTWRRTTRSSGNALLVCATETKTASRHRALPRRAWAR